MRQGLRSSGAPRLARRGEMSCWEEILRTWTSWYWVSQRETQLHWGHKTWDLAARRCCWPHWLGLYNTKPASCDDKGPNCTFDSAEAGYYDSHHDMPSRHHDMPSGQWWWPPWHWASQTWGQPDSATDRCDDSHTDIRPAIQCHRPSWWWPTWCGTS